VKKKETKEKRRQRRKREKKEKRKKEKKNRGSNRYYQRNDTLVLEVKYSEQIKLSFLSE
jgi:hypothetical protein